MNVSNVCIGVLVDNMIVELFMFVKHQTTKRTRCFDSDKVFDIFIWI